MPSIFTKIINREIPGHIVAEDDRYIALLDINPLVMGHVLVIPKEETDYIFDLSNDALTGLTLFAKKIGQAIKQVVPCKRVGVAVIGLEVPHVHIHLVPMNTVGDINFTRAKLNPTIHELEEISAKIRTALTS
jgi:histidine triad (HIT) family protein